MTLDLVYKSSSQTRAVRVAMLSGDPWFVAADVCSVLEIENQSQAVSRLDVDEIDNIITNDAIGRQRSTTVISESGLYSLVLTSRKPEAKAFKKWITSEVLPAIRKTGSYSIAPALPDDPLSLALHASLETRKDLARLEQRTANLEQRMSEEALRSSDWLPQRLANVQRPFWLGKLPRFATRQT
jgi:prophage antirepressor-like protein